MQTLSKRTESLQKLTSRRLQILSYCAHYRYLDFKHLLALLGDTNTNDYTTTRALEREPPGLSLEL